jgi:acetate kinase
MNGSSGFRPSSQGENYQRYHPDVTSGWGSISGSGNFMNILVLNHGSATVKYELFSMDDTSSSILASGILERHGSEVFILSHFPKGKEKVKETIQTSDEGAATKLIVEAFIHPRYGVIKDIKEIGAVGHRVVHGGEKFTESALITPKVKSDIKECISFAPLHNPHNLKGIEIAQDYLPEVPHVAVFDTVFHSRMPPHAYLYALPYSYYKKYGIRRYGFHGTSHYYVSRRIGILLKKSIKKLRIITCHLGNGASIAAIKNKKCIDTSMGFTPLEGLVMGTRCGSIDPAIPIQLISQEALTPGEVNSLLNRYSGLLGISGISNNMKDIISEMKKGNERAKLAFDIFTYTIRKYIAGYAAAMGGVDVIVFTAGIGENSPDVRESCLEDLGFMGVKIDRRKNKATIAQERLISHKNSKVKVFCIPTDEQLVIAKDTYNIAIRSGKWQK